MIQKYCHKVTQTVCKTLSEQLDETEPQLPASSQFTLPWHMDLNTLEVELNKIEQEHAHQFTGDTFPLDIWPGNANRLSSRPGLRSCSASLRQHHALLRSLPNRGSEARNIESVSFRCKFDSNHDGSRCHVKPAVLHFGLRPTHVLDCDMHTSQSTSIKL